MQQTENYLKGRVNSILAELDEYEKETVGNEEIARKLYEQIKSGETSKPEVKKFLELEYTAHINMSMTKNLLIQLRELKLQSDTLDIKLDISEKHLQIFDHIKKDNPLLFVFKSGKKEFVNELAEQMYSQGLANYLSDQNIERAIKEIQKDVDTKQ